jgi:hypothetical protein
MHYMHGFVYKHVCPNKTVEWLLPLSHFKDSAVATLRCTPVQAKHSDHTYFDFKFNTEPSLVGVFEISKHTIGIKVRWRSWAWQWHTVHSMRGLAPAVRLFAAGPETPVPCIAASEACWDLSQSVIAQFCEYWKIPLPPGGDLMETIATVAKHWLEPLADDDLLMILRKRVTGLKRKSKFADSLLHMDESVQLLDHHDHEALTEQQRQACRDKEDLVIVAEHYASLAKVVAAGAKGRGRGKGKAPPGGGHAHVYPKHLREQGVLTQAWAKPFVPSGGSLWKGVARGEWWGHFPPEERVHHKWADSSEYSALKYTLQDLWRQHNWYHADPTDQCPIKGIFDEAALP